MNTSTQLVSTKKDACLIAAKPDSSLPLAPGLLHVTERVQVTTKDAHPGWVRATSILLRGMERLRLQELAEAAQADSEALPSNSACLSFSQ